MIEGMIEKRVFQDDDFSPVVADGDNQISYTNNTKGTKGVWVYNADGKICEVKASTV